MPSSPINPWYYTMFYHPSAFLPFGESAGDTRVTPGDDASSLAIGFTCQFFGRQENVLYVSREGQKLKDDHFAFLLQVSTNGVLSFRKSFTSHSPKAFPIENDVLIIAPLWADSDNRKGGQVYYRVSDEQSLLRRIAVNVNRVFEVNFSPTQAFVATWNGMPQFGSSRSPDVVSNT